MMPRSAQHTIRWFDEQARYLLVGLENAIASSLVEDDTEWQTWLEQHRAFAFHGRNGQISLLKEQRSRGGSGYWYAYRRHRTRVLKRYIGSNIGNSSQVSLERLEKIAAELSRADEPAQSVRVSLTRGSRRITSSRTKESAGESPRPTENVALTTSTVFPEPLLLTKLQLPRYQPSLLPREHLLQLLDKGLAHKVTLIAVAAGYGKTTLLGQWIAARRARPDFPRVACITLDEEDNDPVRFWRYIIATCQQFQAGLGKVALELLHAHRLLALKPLEMMLITLLNDLSQLEQPAVLILDDLHVITSPRIIVTLDYFLEHLPAQLHLILLMRGGPPFSITRLRARNELLDISPHSLRFSLAETGAFLAQELSIPLSPRIIAHVYERLEGWPAGLRFLVETLHWPDEHDIEQALTTFSGSTLNLQEYFVHEILHALSEEQQAFLLHTCTLPCVTASLCDALMERDDSAQQLATLRGGDFFLMPLDWEGEWARYYPLFAEAMQQEARRSLGEARMRELAARASHWYEKHEQLPEAIETALSAHEYARVAGLIAQFIERQYQAHTPIFPELHRLKRWLERLPETELERHPDLCIHAALTLLFPLLEEAHFPQGQERIHHLLQVTEQRWRDSNTTDRLAEVFAFRALLARLEGRILQAVTWGRQALAWLPEDEHTRPWRVQALTAVGIGELYDGTLAAARERFLEVLRLDERQSSLVGARATRGRLSRVSFEQAALHQAAELLRQIQAEARRQQDHDDIARTQLGLAQIAYQWNDLAEAEQAAREALSLGEQIKVEEVTARATALLARIAHACGQTAQAQQQLTAWLARKHTPSSPHDYQLSREVQAQLTSIQLACSELSPVKRWPEHHEEYAENLPRYQRQCEQLLSARLLLAQKDVITAIERLEHLNTATLRSGHLHLRLEIQVVLALAYSRQGVQTKAREQLIEVLETARSEGYLRLFLDEGEEVASLLRALLPSLRKQALLTYLQYILNAFARDIGLPGRQTTGDTPLLSKLLSPQEQKVLSLLSEGSSNAEIASTLVVSVNTVRTQLQSIYRKLNVNNRVQASMVARRLDLGEPN